MPSPRRGFTLIELLIVIAILAIILAALFYFIDPRKRINMAHNATRRTDAAAIAKAVSLDISDEKGEVSDASRLVKRKWKMLGTAPSGCTLSCGDFGRSVSALHMGSGTESGDVVVPWQDDLSLSMAQPFTLSLWLKETNDGGHGILGKDSRKFSEPGYSLATYKYIDPQSGEISTYLIFFLRDSHPCPHLNPNATCMYFSVFENVLTAHDNNVYAHIALRWDGAQLSVYKNGAFLSSAEPTPIETEKPVDQPKEPLHIGSVGGDILSVLSVVASQLVGPNQNVSTIDHRSYFSGTMDDVRLYKGALSESDIHIVKQGGEPRDPSIVTVAHWMLDETDGKGVEDSSDFTHDGKISGTTDWVTDTPALAYELPSPCINLTDELTQNGYLPKIPVGLPAQNVLPTAAQTYYIIRNKEGTISVRSCLSEGEGPNGGGTGPAIEVSQ